MLSDLCLGDDDITVSTQVDPFNTVALSTLSRRIPVLTMIARLFRSLCLRRLELAMDVCLVRSSHSGAGSEVWAISTILFPDPDGELLSRSSTLPLSGSSRWKYNVLSAISCIAEGFAGLMSCGRLGPPAFSPTSFFWRFLRSLFRVK